jgi:hypothetical protein
MAVTRAEAADEGPDGFGKVSVSSSINVLQDLKVEGLGARTDVRI